MKRLVGLAALIGLSACAPPPRDVSFFEAHPEEARQVVSACARGRHRGDECLHARAGLSAIRQEARMEAFRKGFSED